MCELLTLEATKLKNHLLTSFSFEQGRPSTSGLLTGPPRAAA